MMDTEIALPGPPVGADLVFDIIVFTAGFGLGLASLAHWVAGAPVWDCALLGTVVLIVVMSRYPLTIPQRSSDAVIGFEVTALVFLVLVAPPDAALGLWCVGQVLSQLLDRHRSWRSRLFNIGITVLCGGLFVLAYSLGVHLQGPHELVVLAAACVVFFIMDVVVTAASLALEAREPLRSALGLGSLALPLLIFLAVSTLGYLAAVLDRGRADWAMLLLLVPVATILLAAKSISDARLASLRLRGLFDAATQAPDWGDQPRMERALVEQVEKVFRHSKASWSAEPVAPGRDVIASVLAIDDRPDRWLVVERASSHGGFEPADVSALEMLAAMGVATLERCRLTDEMSYLAMHDVLTGLHNRGVFADRLEHALSSRHYQQIAVLFCDLDGFKAVNDQYGHAIGDALIQAVAGRLRGCVRPSDTLARLGGDEFAVLVMEPDGDFDVTDVARRVLGALEAPFSVGPGPIRVRASVGLARNQPGQTASDVMRNADTAMYRAKAEGKDRVAVFEPSMQADNLLRIELQEELRSALENRLLTFCYQPVVELSSGQMDGVELLARWDHPRLGAISPEVFVPLVEQMGFGLSLVEQLFAAARVAAVELTAAAGRPVSLAVNLTPDQATDPRVRAMVSAMRADHPDVPFVLEITEGTLLVDDERTREALDALAATGAVLAVDDFGVGYSSIGYLLRYPIRILKIDKSIVQSCHEPRARPLIEGVVAMARSMALKVVAEGVEDWETAARITQMGCDVGQGYLFSPPVPLARLLVLAASGRFDLSPATAQARELALVVQPPRSAPLSLPRRRSSKAGRPARAPASSSRPRWLG